MTTREFQIEFERRLKLMDPTLTIENKLSSDTIFSFLNEAVDKFVKTRYSGLNTKGEGFEQSQKRIDDLRTLIKTAEYKNLEQVELPNDYVILLGDTAGIKPVGENECWNEDDTKYTDTIEATIETIDRQLSNTLSEHRLKYNTAKPLRLIESNKIKLYTDGKYRVAEYKIMYLSTPAKLSKDDLNAEYTSLPSHTHMEIVKMAVQIYMATKPMQHYSVYSTEVNNME